MKQRSSTWVIAGLVAAFLAVFLLWPIAGSMRNAFVDNRGFTLIYVAKLFTNPVQWQAIINSTVIACWVTLLCSAIALPLAWVFSRYSFRAKALWSALLLMPMIMPPFVSSVGMKMVFARAGALSTLLMQLGIADGPTDWFGHYPMFGIVLLEALHLFPVMYLNLVAALSNIDPSLEEAAANIGANPLRAFTRVTLPLSAPGLFAGMVITFIWSFTELGTPLVFGFRRVLPVLVYDSVAEIGTNPAGYAQVVFVLAVSAVGFWISKSMTSRQRNVATLGRLSLARTEKRLPASTQFALGLALAALLSVALLPHISAILLASSRRWFLTVLPEGFTMDFFGQAIGSDLTSTALLNSLKLSLGATAIDLILGFSIAWLCVRRRIIGGGMLDVLAMLPLAVPGIVMAFGYLGTFSGIFGDGSPLKGTFIEQYFNPRLNPMILLAVSYSIRRLPYMVRSAHAGLEQVSRTYEEAAANLGASPLRVVWRVTLPLTLANLMAGAILCFAFSMLEVSDSLILAQSETFFPITKAIYALLDGLENGLNVAAALGVWATVLLGAGMLWAAALMGRKLGQMFRI